MSHSLKLYSVYLSIKHISFHEAIKTCFLFIQLSYKQAVEFRKRIFSTNKSAGFDRLKPSSHQAQIKEEEMRDCGRKVRSGSEVKPSAEDK